MFSTFVIHFPEFWIPAYHVFGFRNIYFPESQISTYHISCFRNVYFLELSLLSHVHVLDITISGLYLIGVHVAWTRRKLSNMTVFPNNFSYALNQWTSIWLLLPKIYFIPFSWNTVTSRYAFCITGPSWGESIGDQGKGQWCGALIFSDFLACQICWTNSREVGVRRQFTAHVTSL